MTQRSPETVLEKRLEASFASAHEALTRVADLSQQHSR